MNHLISSIIKKELKSKCFQLNMYLKKSFSTMHPCIAVQKSLQFQFKLRTIVKSKQLSEYINQNKQELKMYGKTILLDHLNEYPMQSFLRSRDIVSQYQKIQKRKYRKSIYYFLAEMEDLNVYQRFLRYSIYHKYRDYVFPDQFILQKIHQYQTEIMKDFQQGRINDIVDAINWLFLLPINFKGQMCLQGLKIVNQYLAHPQNYQYIGQTKRFSVILKRISELDWLKARKLKNIIKFITYHAKISYYDNMNDLLVNFERIVQFRLHLLGQKTIPNILDQICQRFEQGFALLVSNNVLLMKIFACYRHLPLSFNRGLFNRIHLHLKREAILSSHILLYIPYNKLSLNEITYLQNKAFVNQSADIAAKTIYTIYSDIYKDVLTPFMIKEVYNNMMDKSRFMKIQNDNLYQIYFALIFRFNKMDSPLIDQAKLKVLFMKTIDMAECRKYSFISMLAPCSILTILDLIYTYKYYFDQELARSKFDALFKLRRNKNNTFNYNNLLIQAIRVHYNSRSPIVRQYITKFFHYIISNPQSRISHKVEVLFSIEKSNKYDQKWAQVSEKLYQNLIPQIQAVIQQYIKYQGKTVKLTNFIMNKLYKLKSPFDLISMLVSSLSVKLLTSMKGKLLLPLNKYLNEMDIQKFDISNSSLNSLINTFKLIFCFKKQIKDFLQYFAIQLIDKIYKKCENQQYFNGKQFSSISMYIIQSIEDIQIQKKTFIIQQIAQILRIIRKRQGIMIKVYEFQFLSTYSQYISVNKQALQLQGNQIVATLQKNLENQNYRQLYFILLKLHCLGYLTLNQKQIRSISDRCIQMIQQGSFGLTQIKQSLGYQLQQGMQDQIKKAKSILGKLIKIAFSCQKHKINYFVYEYFFRYFNITQQINMVIKICEILLHQKLYPTQTSNIIRVLNSSSIKCELFQKRILQILVLSHSYITFQNMQALSWMQKTNYQLSYQTEEQNLIQIKSLVKKYMNDYILQLKDQMKKNLQINVQNKQDNQNDVQDTNFNKNLKNFIDYAWIVLKNKQVDQKSFQFICRYIFKAIHKIKNYLQNPIQNKQLSRVKLSHILKYIKESRFFQFSQNSLNQVKTIKQQQKDKLKQLRLITLKQLQNQLNMMQKQRFQNLQDKFTRICQKAKWQYNYKHRIHEKQSNSSVTQYYVQGLTQKQISFCILTVKDYHKTPTTISKLTFKPISYQVQQAPQINSVTHKTKIDQFTGSGKLGKLFERKKSLQAPQVLSELAQKNKSIVEPKVVQKIIPRTSFFKKASNKSTNTSDKSTNTSDKSTNTSDKSTKIVNPQNTQFTLTSTTIYDLTNTVIQSSSDLIQRQCKQLNSMVSFFQVKAMDAKKLRQIRSNYNGYLKAQRSIIELITKKKCIIYDPTQDVFFI